MGNEGIYIFDNVLSLDARHAEAHRPRTLGVHEARLELNGLVFAVCSIVNRAAEFAELLDRLFHAGRRLHGMNSIVADETGRRFKKHERHSGGMLTHARRAERGVAGAIVIDNLARLFIERERAIVALAPILTALNFATEFRERIIARNVLASPFED